MVVDKFVQIKITKRNINYYKSLGYNCCLGEEIKVDINHLPRYSKTKISIMCDYCHKVFKRIYTNHIKQLESNIIKKDSCVKCAGKKRIESNLLVYGVENIAQLESTKLKIKNTIKKKYGVDHQMHLQEVKEKIKNTNLIRYGETNPMKVEKIKQKVKDTMKEKYGVDSYNKTEEFKMKVKKTNIQKYGVENVFQLDKFKEKQKETIRKKYNVDNVFQSEEIKNKIRETLLKKYGVDNLMKIPLIKEKVIKKQKESLYKNGSAQTSKQQLYLHNLLGGELNYQVDNLNLDIAFPDEKIYIEYNGGGHDLQVKMGRISYEDFIQSEIKRYLYLKSKGWRQISINSPRDYLPSDEIIIQEFNKAKIHFNNGHWHYKIDISDKVFDQKFGQLRKIDCI